MSTKVSSCLGTDLKNTTEGTQEGKIFKQRLLPGKYIKMP